MRFILEIYIKSPAKRAGLCGNLIGKLAYKVPGILNREGRQMHMKNDEGGVMREKL
jgi:hypothetical protein